jgi:hypothetical protein
MSLANAWSDRSAEASRDGDYEPLTRGGFASLLCSTIVPVAEASNGGGAGSFMRASRSSFSFLRRSSEAISWRACGVSLALTTPALRKASFRDVAMCSQV